MIAMAKTRIPGYISCDPLKDIQILSPIKKSDLGIINLNRVLQDVFNPPSDKLNEKKYGEIIYRCNDKVMQIKNNYNVDWKMKLPNGTYSKGKGVFNGDMGFISHINNEEQTLIVEFEDSKIIEY